MLTEILISDEVFGMIMLILGSLIGILIIELINIVKSFQFIETEEINDEGHLIYVKTFRSEKREAKVKSKLKLQNLKRNLKKGSYDWDKAIENTADRIIDNPESLLWK